MEEANMLRKCTQCGVIAHTAEELTKFVKRKQSKHGYRSLCKECHRNDKRYRKEPEYYYDRLLRSRYGITIDDYNKMFKDQNGCCAICKKHQTETDKRLYVDHDHDTGIVRQLLCQHCNTLIGFANDDVEILSEAINYLNKHRRK